MARDRSINFLRRPTVARGPVRLSKRVIDRWKAVASLCGTIRALGREAAAGFAEHFKGQLGDGEAVPDQTLALELAVRKVEAALALLVDADKVYCRDAMRRHRLVDTCQHVARVELYPEVAAVRREIEAVFGRVTGRQLHGLEGRTRRKPEALQSQARQLLVQLQRPASQWPPARLAVDPSSWSERVKPGYDKLKTALDALMRAEMREARLRDDRDYELECFDIDYAETLAYVRAVFRLAGYGERVTWHLLPTVQRRRLRKKARQEQEARAEGLRPEVDEPDDERADLPSEEPEILTEPFG